MFEQGKVTHLVFFHDDDCPQLQGGQCACSPDMELRASFPWDLYPPRKKKDRRSSKEMMQEYET